MRSDLRIGGLLLGALGSILLPSFILGLVVLIPLSVLAPFVGVAFGFMLDSIFGSPTWLPAAIAYPFTLIALLVAVATPLLSNYLR